MKFGNWILLFITLSFSILITSEGLANYSAAEDEDVNVADVFEPRIERFWTKGLRLSLGEKIATQPAICTLGEEIYVVWSDNRVGQRVLFMRRSRDGGLTWGEEEQLTASKTDSIRPAIASDNKQVHLVWEERNETNSEIFYKRWDGTGWSKERVLSEGLSNARRPDVAVTTSSSASMVYVVWESSVQNRLVAYLTRSADGGVTWSEPRPIANITNASDIPAWNTSEPRVACGERTAYVVWRDEREITSQIFIKRWDDVSSGNDIRLSSEGDYRRPDVSVSEPSVYVAWEGNSGGTSAFVSDIFVAQSFDGGQTFSRALQVTQSAAESTMPKIIALSEDNPLTPFGKGDDVWLFWQDGRLGNWDIYLAQKSSRNQNWGQPQQFTSTDIDSIMPVASRGEQIHLLWVARESDTESHLMYSRRDTIPPLPPDKPAHLDVNSPKGYDNDDTLTFYWLYPSVNRLDGTESVHYIERPAKYNVYFTTLEEAQNAELKNRAEFQLAGTTDKSSYSFKAESGKTYRVAVESVDEVGNASELSAFSDPIFVDSHAPEVFIHLPKAHASLVESTPVIVTCRDDNLVEWRLQYKFTTRAALSQGESGLAWQLLASSNESAEYQRVALWDVSGLKGVYTLELIAVDAAGNQSKADIPVVVDSNPPIPIISDGIGTELAISDLEADYHSPVWSPDGSMIAYASNEGGVYDIWIFDLKNGSKKRLTHDTAFDANPVWSPDSRWLAFQSFENDNWHICLIDVDGSERVSIVEAATDQSDFAMYTTPAWSPNGDQLAFSSDRGGDGEIWLIKNLNEVLQGGKPTFIQLTQNEKPRKVRKVLRIPSQCLQWEDSSPTWSPDGTKIAFQSNRNGNWDIFRINVDGSQEEQLTDSVANEIKPKWSPDGKRILFISDNSEFRIPNSKFRSQGEILALEIHNREIISLTPIGVDAQHADWSPDMKSMVYQAGNNIYITDFNFPLPQIEAVITRPYEGEYIFSGQSKGASEVGGMEGLPSNEVKGWGDGLVDIIGIARGTNFKEYRLEYAPVDSISKLQISNSEFRIPNSGGWIPVGGVSTSQVPQVGFLGRLDTRGLQGEYILKLSVLGQNGEIAADDVSFFVENESPRLVVAEPPDGLITDNPLIVVSGETEADAQVTINDEPVKLQLKSQTARFDISLLLEEGDNVITIVARHTEFGIRNSEFGLETVVQRHVFLDTQGITINVEDPKDFEVVNVPYATVKGNVSQIAKVVKILETTVIGPEIQAQDEDLKRFQRTILLHEGMNVISIEAIDQLNRIARIQRRVIYEKPAVIGRDANPPGITNIIPPDGAVIADARPEISAILVDDVKIAPETITFTFDGKEIDREKFDFNEKDGRFSYIPEESFLDDGEHNFTISVQDAFDNSAQKAAKFFIDTEPLEIAISATKDNSRLKVILTSNKPLQSIPRATIIVRSSAIYCALTNGDESPYYKQSDCLGYSINLNQVVTGKAPPFSFEALFDATPLQNSFIFDAAVIDKFGDRRAVHGYYVRGELSEGIVSSWGQMKIETDLHPSETTQKMESETGISEVNRIGISGIAEAIFPVTILKPVHGIVLRSQDGLDLDRLTAQRQNAEDRSLEPIDIVHMVEAGQKVGEATFILKLPIPKESPKSEIRNPNSESRFALFHWDARLQRWDAMDAIRDFSEGWIQAKADEFGAYALLSDKTPPTIANLRPKDHQEVPLDRFLVEAEVYDDGSGIDRESIELLIDDRPAEFTYEPAHNRITYLPGNLKEGLHTLKLSVQDRASNIQKIDSTFFTSDIFDFAEEVIAYPNPVRNADIVTIRFKLTKTADVTLKIYSVAGETIYSEKKNNAIGRRNEWFAWDGKNQAKFPVASGVYIYILEAENSTGQKVRRSGKIAVVK